MGASTSIRACGAAGELQDDIAINSDVPAVAPNAVHTQAGSWHLEKNLYTRNATSLGGTSARKMEALRRRSAGGGATWRAR